MKNFDGDYNRLAAKISDLRGQLNAAPKGSIIIPVNAQGDLKNVLNIVDDISKYSGPHTLELVLVINNYLPEEPPKEIESYANLGIKILNFPYLRKQGEGVGLTARIPGLQAAHSEYTMLFDADCRIPNVTKLINWYINNYDNGIDTAYTHVDYYNLRNKLSIKVRMFFHHFSRWVKRKIFDIPTMRGSNYAIRRSFMLELYEKGYLAEDMNIGPVAKRFGSKIAYSGNKDLVVLTSGRMFHGSWISLFRYLVYRLKYNFRVLRVRENAAKYTGRNPETDPDRIYIDNEVVKK